MESFLSNLQTPLAFLFVLGVLVFVHEFGHFIVARWYGVRVITFSLGFGPKIVKVQRGDTEYCISAVPLGGYVKLAGETVEDVPVGAPDEFLSQSKWVRFQVYLAGPTMNILLAVIVLAGVLSFGADVPLYEQSAPVVGSVSPDSPAATAGLKVGDRIVSVDSEPVATWEALQMAVLPKANRELRIGVLREGQTTEVRVTPRAVTKYDLGDLGVAPLLRPYVLDVFADRPAIKAGLKKGDVVLAFNGQKDMSQPDIIKGLRANAGKPVVMTVERPGVEAPLDITVVPEGAVGSATIGAAISPWEVRRIDPNLLQAFRMSAEKNWTDTKLIGKTLKGLFTAQTPVNQLMGPLAIGELAGNAARLGWIELFGLMSMISLNLGLINLMPVPVLDGGHIAILAVEGLARRDLSIRVKERILMVGAAMIVLLMVTVIFNDVARLLR
jgi:regulator of sigma E protease